MAFAAVFAVGALWLFWGTWSCGSAPIAPDDYLQVTWTWSDAFNYTLRRFLSSGRFLPTDPLWDGLIFSPAFCKELRYASAGLASAIALAWFLRGRGLSYLASCGAGLFLAFCGYWFSLFSAGHAGWFEWMTYGVFAFGLIDRALEKGGARYWILLGSSVAWASFYQPDLWLMFTAFTGVYFVFRSVIAKKLDWKGILLAAVFFFAVGAPSFYNAVVNDLAGREKMIADSSAAKPADGKDAPKQVSEEERWIFVTNWSLPSEETAELFFPRINGDTSCVLTQALGAQAGNGTKPYTGAIGRPYKAPAGNYRQHSVYVGFLTGLFALVALVSLGFGSKANRRTVLFFAIAALVFYLLSLGRYCEPVYRCVFALPIGDAIRCPVKWHHLTELCLAVLAGFGIEAAAKFLSGRLGSKGLWLVAALVLVGVFDLVRVNRCFLAPVDYSAALDRKADMQLTFLRQQDFQNPQVAAMQKAGAIKSLAYYPGRKDVYLVGIMSPHKSDATPLPPFGLPSVLGILSLAAGAVALGWSVVSLRRKPRE